MGNTRDTGYLRNLVAYDASGNIVLPANLTVTGSIVGYATTSYVTTQINNLINGAPGLLDTLDELAAALGDDANFASTITTSIAGKLSLTGGTLTGALSGTSASFSGNVSLNLPSIGGTRELQFSYFNATNAKTIIRATGTSDFRQHLDILMNTAQSDSAPTQVVRIANSGAATFSSSVTSNVNGFVTINGYGLTSYPSSSATGANIIFSSSIYGGIDGIYQSSGNASDFAIWTNGGSSTQPKLMIKNGGNVGIGTVNPATQLNVGHENHGLGFAYIGSSSLPSIAGLFTDTGANGGQGYGSLQIKSRSDYAGYSINFFTAASNNTPLERLRITSGGNVEIGTVSTSGGRTLTIRASSGNSASLRLQNTVHDWDVNCQTNNRFAIFSHTDGVERFVIMPTSGNVLIGTITDDGYKFHVNGSAYATTLDLGFLGLNVSGYNFYSQTISGAMGILGHNLRASGSVANQVNVMNSGWYSSMIKMYYNEGITFHTSTTSYSAGNVYPIAGTERMRIAFTGRIGMGTNDPIDQLHVAGGITSTGLATPTTTSIGSLQIGYDGTNGIIRTWASSPLIFSNYNYQSFQTSGSERMLITSNGAVTKPFQPAWSVGLNGAQSYLTNVPSVIFWNQSSGNDCFVQGGVTLNGDLGRITVPVAGKYMIFASIRTEATGAANGTNLNLRRNGTTILRHYVGSAVNSQGSFMYIETRPVIINCAANDYIDFQFDSIPADFVLSSTSNTVVRFGGFLMG